MSYPTNRTIKITVGSVTWAIKARRILEAAGIQALPLRGGDCESMIEIPANDTRRALSILASAGIRYRYG